MSIKKPKRKIKKTIKKKIKKNKVGFWYKNIALSFVGAVLVLTIIILFVSSARATITITPQKEEIKTTFTTQTDLNQEKKQGTISGYLIETTVEKEEAFQSSQVENREVPATGEVIIINNYSKNQPLIATTRLLSKEGVLFRLTNSVKVPAGGKIKAEVYADKPGKQGEIGPTRFTIPGLWTGLQDKIYAISEKPMAGGIKEMGYVTQEDIDQGKEKLKNELRTQGFQELKTKLKNIINANNGNLSKYNIKQQLISEEIVKENVEAKAGEQKNEFSIKTQMKFTTVVLDEKALFDLAKNKLKKKLSKNKKLISIDQDGFTYTLEKYDPATNTAKIKVSLSGKATILLTDPIFKKERLTGLDKKEIEKYFSQFNKQIKDVKIEFFPFWIRRTPNIKNHLGIELVK